MLKVVVLVSGGGTNLQAIIDGEMCIRDSGIIVLVVGVATGILAIVNGAKLLKHKKEITC